VTASEALSSITPLISRWRGETTDESNFLALLEQFNYKECLVTKYDHFGGWEDKGCIISLYKARKQGETL
jgi:hypothetical protein